MVTVYPGKWFVELSNVREVVQLNYEIASISRTFLYRNAKHDSLERYHLDLFNTNIIRTKIDI